MAKVNFEKGDKGHWSLGRRYWYRRQWV